MPQPGKDVCSKVINKDHCPGYVKCFYTSVIERWPADRGGRAEVDASRAERKEVASTGSCGSEQSAPPTPGPPQPDPLNPGAARRTHAGPAAGGRWAVI